jgi:ABC-type transport system involved in cytochrome bd biosynthesis fused ATPase/permease subunit
VNERALYTDFKYYDDPDFFTKFQFAQQSYPNQAESAMWIVPRTVQCVMIIIAMSSIIISAGSILFGLTILFVIVNALIGLPTLKADANFQVKSVETWRPFDYVTRILQQKENAAELRSSGAGVKFLKTVVVVAERYRAVYYTYMKKILPFSTVQALVSPLQIACVLLYIILFVINGDVSKIGLYASLTAASATLASGLNGAYSSINTLVNSTLYGERIAAFFETKSEIEPIVEGKTLPPEGKYEVELKNVTFAYQNSSFCIENLNLHIKPGQRIAIVG